MHIRSQSKWKEAKLKEKEVSATEDVKWSGRNKLFWQAQLL